MREYNPFLSLEEVKQAGLLDDFFPDNEEVAIVNNKSGFIPLEEFPDNSPDQLELLILKEEGAIIEDELDDDSIEETDDPYNFTKEDLKPFFEPRQKTKKTKRA